MAATVTSRRAEGLETLLGATEVRADEIPERFKASGASFGGCFGFFKGARPSRVYMGFLLAISFLIWVLPTPRVIKTNLVHFTRPIWQAGKFRDATYIPNLGFVDKEISCPLHGGVPREEPRRVFSAFAFDHELDLLELRLEELSDLIHAFILVENDQTFTLKSKERHYKKNKARFSKWRNKIEAVEMKFKKKPEGAAAPDSVRADAFSHERQTRTQIQVGLKKRGVARGDIVIISDTDEIVSRDAVNLLKHCDFPRTYLRYEEPLCLQTRNYYYSFEWRDGEWSNYPNAWMHTGEPDWSVSRATGDVCLGDAGWHCSWCFEKISDYVHKMQSYSHTEHNTPEFTNPERIQTQVCEGKDLFGRYRDRFTYKEIFALWDGSFNRERSITGLPGVVQRNPEKYKYLLPGQCLRPDAPESFKEHPQTIHVTPPNAKPYPFPLE